MLLEVRAVEVVVGRKREYTCFQGKHFLTDDLISSKYFHQFRSNQPLLDNPYIQ